MTRPYSTIYSNTTSQYNFQDAEHLWFWFISSMHIKNGFSRNNDYNCRPCELLDVETLVTRLYLSGKFTSNQLEVMKKYGELRRAPNQYVFSENKDAILWHNAMRQLAVAARSKGWIE
jgi:hypothetical protein